MKNNTESLDLFKLEQRWFLRLSGSKWFTLIAIILLMLVNVMVFICYSPSAFQRFGSFNVGFGVALLVLSSARIRRLERQLTLQNFALFTYEISRLSSEVLELRDGGHPPDSREAFNKEAVFGNHVEFDFESAQRLQKAAGRIKEEVRLALIVELLLILFGTIQWGYGDLISIYI
jgi:hypothetical protein